MSTPEAAVAIIRARSPEDSVLLIRRAEREDDSWSGHWSLPGGRRAPSDPDLLHTALRELAEECGVVLAPRQMETALPHSVARRRTGDYLLVAPFVFRIEDCCPTVLDTTEAVESFWIPLRVLQNPAYHALRPVPGRPPEVLFPAIELNCVPLWGFTYRLLSDWLLPPPEPRAGLDAARRVLAWLITEGLPLHREFDDREAAVGGAIPVAALIAHFSRPASFHPGINCLEAGAARVRIFGPEFEEYIITADAVQR